MSFWVEQEVGPCVACQAMFICRKLGQAPARSCCFDCQREFVFLPRSGKDDMYPTVEGHPGCCYATPRKTVVWCPTCKQELDSLLHEQQVPISMEVLLGQKESA